MSPPTRRIGSRLSPVDLGLSDLDDLPEESTPAEDPDPARLAVLRMIARALASSGLTPKAAGRDGTVTLIMLPAACWITLTRNAWRDVARGGQGYRDGGLDRDWHRGKWAAWAPLGEPRGSLREDAADLFATAVAKASIARGSPPTPVGCPLT